MSRVWIIKYFGFIFLLKTDCQVFPLGSIVTGLASNSSDADCMVKLPNYAVASDVELVLQAANVLKSHPLLYSQVTPKVHPTRRIPLLKFNYVPTNRNCDVNFISDLGLQNSLMMGYYLNLDKKFLSLAVILKYWSKVHGLRGSDTLASNTLNLLIIFYLQQENLIPPYYNLRKHSAISPVAEWVTTFEPVPYNLTVSLSLYELLGRFFKYYSTFDFEEYIVSPLLGRPIFKQVFEDLDNLPEELFMYKSYLRRSVSKPFVLHTKLCIQDAIEERRNTAADATDSNVNEFFSLVRFAAGMFDVIPKDLFLKVLFEKDPSKYSAIRKIGLSEIIRLKHFVNVNYTS